MQWSELLSLQFVSELISVEVIAMISAVINAMGSGMVSAVTRMSTTSASQWPDPELRWPAAFSAVTYKGTFFSMEGNLEGKRRMSW